jgi:hypothetical protein
VVAAPILRVIAAAILRRRPPFAGRVASVRVGARRRRMMAMLVIASAVAATVVVTVVFRRVDVYSRRDRMSRPMLGRLVMLVGCCMMASVCVMAPMLMASAVRRVWIVFVVTCMCVATMPVSVCVARLAVPMRGMMRCVRMMAGRVAIAAAMPRAALVSMRRVTGVARGVRMSVVVAAVRARRVTVVTGVALVVDGELLEGVCRLGGMVAQRMRMGAQLAQRHGERASSSSAAPPPASAESENGHQAGRAPDQGSHEPTKRQQRLSQSAAMLLSATSPWTVSKTQHSSWHEHRASGRRDGGSGKPDKPSWYCA